MHCFVLFATGSAYQGTDLRDSSAALCSANVLVPFLSPSSSTPFKENTLNSSSMSGMSYSSYASILSSNLRYVF